MSIFDQLRVEAVETKKIKPWAKMDLHEEFPAEWPMEKREAWQQMEFDVRYPSPAIRTSFFRNTGTQVARKVKGLKQKQTQWEPDPKKAAKYFAEYLIQDWNAEEKNKPVPYDHKAKAFLKEMFETSFFLYDGFSAAYLELMGAISSDEEEEEQDFLAQSTSSEKNTSQDQEESD